MNNSKKLFSDAKKVIPSGVNSPVRYFEPYPFFVKRSQGSSLWDEDGNRFVDFCNGYGALLLGHTRKEIITAASHQMKKGTLYTTPTSLEIDLSQLIIKNFPSMQKVRTMNTGAEATMTAIRLARGFTKKKKIINDVSFGIDLEEIANKKKCSVVDIIRLHTETDYLVYFIGFQPGFLYLGGLHRNLHIPRKSNPRVRVDKGSVGIGGSQTGVYPQDSSGGWNIIGKSPLNFFDINASESCFAKPGDRIQFVAVDIHSFYQIEREVINQEFIIKKRLL